MSEQTLAFQEKKRPKRKKHILRKLLIALLILALLAGAGLYAYFSLKQEYTVTYTGYTASTGSISNALSFSGSLSLIDNMTYAAGAASTVRSVYVKAGDNVQAGDKLMRLANGETIKADFDGMVAAMRADAAAAKVKMENMLAFAEKVWPEGQEMLILVTELTISWYAARFISRYGCESYYRHNEELMLYERHSKIISQLNILEEL